ncbi:MAG: MASE1 domain-containing protein, partial [Giesbergeria sp.]|nr:MASE1 domain-containing protein [Giesbergeria sp.]
MSTQRLPLTAQPLGPITAALLYMMVAGTALMAPPDPGMAPLLRPTSGLALALLLLGGPRLAWGVLAGALASHALEGARPVATLAEALASTLAALLGAWLLRRQADFQDMCGSFAACRHLLLYGCGVAAAVGALLASTGLLLTGQIGVAAWPLTLLRGWMGDALGIVLVTPLLLSWWHVLAAQRPLPRMAEGLLLYTLAGVAAQAIFSGWHSDALAPIANAYWMFLFVAWSGVRLGMFATAGLLCLIALQALWGTSQRTGFFAHDLDRSQGLGYGSYMMILSLVGLALAAYMTERRRQKAALRVAAIAFECQEGLLITDPQGVILQANQSFLRMSGHALHEVLGRTPHFLRPPAHALPDGALQAGLEFTPPTAVQRSEWHQRKSGEVYPVWITLSPVQNQHDRITHHVLALTDITDLRQQEAQRRQMEQAHREALVQEVHHRIK